MALPVVEVLERRNDRRVRAEAVLEGVRAGGGFTGGRVGSSFSIVPIGYPRVRKKARMLWRLSHNWQLSTRSLGGKFVL